jgi:hypothetical protein
VEIGRNSGSELTSGWQMEIMREKVGENVWEERKICNKASCTVGRKRKRW